MLGAVFHRRARVRACLALCSALALASCTGKVGDAESSSAGGGPKTGSGGIMSPGSDGGEQLDHRVGQRRATPHTGRAR